MHNNPFNCPICNNPYHKVQALKSSDIENFEYYGLVKLVVDESGQYVAKRDKILATIAMVCNICGHLSLFHAKTFEKFLNDFD